MDLNYIDKIVLPPTWIMDFSNTAKHKYFLGFKKNEILTRLIK